MKFYQPGVSFAAGELNPVLAARVDLAAYSIGAKEVTNMIVLPQGGLINRPGTTPIISGSALYGARLIPFVFNENTAYTLVYKEEGWFSVYNNKGEWKGDYQGRAYTRSELAEIRWLQSADILYIFHPNRRTRKISRYAENDWRVTEVDYKNGPYQDMNTDLTGATVSVGLSNVDMWIETNASTNDALLKSSHPYFTSNHVGLRMRLEYTVAATGGSFTLSYSYDATSPPSPSRSDEFELFGASTIQSGGKWTGLAEIYRKYPDETNFTKIKEYRSTEDYNFGFQTDEEIFGTLYRVDYSRTSGSGSMDVEWSSGGGLIARHIRTYELVDSTTMRFTIQDSLTGDVPPTKDWAWGAFGGVLGYPSLGIFHQERLVLANTPTQRQTIWMSRSASWEDFGTSLPTEDADAITITLAAKRIDDIVGLASRSDLLIFTIGTEWTARAGRNSDVFTPSSVVVTPSGYHGSHSVEPLEIGSNTLFVQRHGKVVRGMGYQLDIDDYASSEISILSSHLFDGTSVKRWAYQQEPWSVVWIVLEDGDVLALTIQQEHKVTAWTRNKFWMKIKDVCCIPGEEQDEVFLLAEEEGTASGTSLLMLKKRVDTSGWAQTDYLDRGMYEYVSSFESMEMEQSVQGSLQGRHKHTPQLTIRVFRTSGFHAGMMTENNRELDQIKFPGDVSPTYRAEPYTGDIYFNPPGGVGRTGTVRIENRRATPFTLLGIFQNVDIDERDK